MRGARGAGSEPYRSCGHSTALARRSLSKSREAGFSWPRVTCRAFGAMASVVAMCRRKALYVRFDSLRKLSMSALVTRVLGA